MQLDTNEGNSALFTALEQEARKKIAPAGYTICNETRDPLLVAMGRTRARPKSSPGKSPSVSVSHGWWTVQPASCAKALTSPLHSETVYLLAQKKNGSALV